MPPAVHILCGPAGSRTSGRLADRYREVAEKAPASALWLGPSQRVLQAYRLLVPEPRLYTFQGFAQEIIKVNDPSARLLTHPQRRLLFDEIVTELHARGKLSHFQGVIDTRGFSDLLFTLITELKNREIRPEQFAAAVKKKGGQSPFFPDALKNRQCVQVYQEYEQRLSQLKLFDLEGRLWHARDLLKGGLRKPFETIRAVFVAGFSDFTPTQFDILAALATDLEEFWITLPDEAGEERTELFAQSRATLARLMEPARGVIPLLTEPGASDLGSPDSYHLEYLERIEKKPPGLTHLERQLFRPLRHVKTSPDATGLLCIEAPGLVGETRLVARQIRRLLDGGTRPDDILVTMRDLSGYVDLVQEIFPEYGIPIDVEGSQPLSGNPGVASLLRTLRLAEDDWPFSGVTALLRSGYFDPDWEETRACPEVALHAEALLRLLGEARHRKNYLDSVERWAEAVQPGLEDEDAEESRRQKTHELAKKCQAFLQHFFRAWDGAPARAPLESHAAWVRRLADDLGFSRQAATDPRDQEVLNSLWKELDNWIKRERQRPGKPRLLGQAAFHRRLHLLAAEVGLDWTKHEPGRVAVLSAESAQHLAVPFAFLMGLGERSFPNLASAGPLFDEAESQALRQAGLDFPLAADRLPQEMLLFYLVATRARRGLVLSYPAVDAKGQALLPSSFLSTLRDCFTKDAIPGLKRRMLIDGYDRDPPLSGAEQRVRLALEMKRGKGPEARGEEGGARGEGVDSRGETRGQGSSSPPLAPRPWSLALHLLAAADLTRQRFESKEHTPYDGLFRDPALIASVGQRFGSQPLFSPTALENYIACPFRFFLGHVLKLEPLEEPREEIESTDRGLAFHRALSRLHTKLKQTGIDQPEGEVDGQMRQLLKEAVQEAERRAGSPAARELWKLEGERLDPAGAQYRAHWEEFIKPWRLKGVRPVPAYFEIDFGTESKEGKNPFGALVIRGEGMEVRFRGRIDRVDLAELPKGQGFWIIDYKTGNPRHYTPGPLREYRRLQLLLYALAVEEVLLAGQEARPLGLAYWLVMDKGAKVVLPANKNTLTWLEDPKAWGAVRDTLKTWVLRLAKEIRQGAFPLKPRSEDCMETCDFGQICRISQVRRVVENKSWKLELPPAP